jgi:F-type H+/Na+-transporting ATPase subunit alpha
MNNIQGLIQEIENSIATLDTSITVSDVGTVVSVADGIAQVAGLTSVQSMEMVSFGSGDTGLALNLTKDTVGVVVFGSGLGITEGMEVKRTNTILQVPVGDAFLGRVVDPLMRPIDEKGVIQASAKYGVEKIAPGVMTREPVNQPLQTGIKAIDAMIPIGRGQRELIIGDRQSGKTTIAIDTIINQKGQNTVCIYVAIGQKESKIAQIVEKLRAAGAMDYTCVVLAGVSQGAVYSYVAPYAGTALAEYFMDQGKDVLVVYDDLSKHAVAYRELSLLLKRPPGREAYPGDVFYLHSRLLERSCRRNAENGGGSITALPIIETQAGDISAYVPTNVISITDGQIFLDSNLFYKGIRPAIDVGLSVSRVGSSAQASAMKKNAGKLKLTLAQYRDLESFSQFDSDLDPETKKMINLGKRAVELLKQDQNAPLRVGLQVASMFALNNGILESIDPKSVQTWEKNCHTFLLEQENALLESIEKGWNDEIIANLKSALARFAQTQS